MCVNNCKPKSIIWWKSHEWVNFVLDLFCLLSYAGKKLIWKRITLGEKTDGSYTSKVASTHDGKRPFLLPGVRLKGWRATFAPSPSLTHTHLRRARQGFVGKVTFFPPSNAFVLGKYWLTWNSTSPLYHTQRLLIDCRRHLHHHHHHVCRRAGRAGRHSGRCRRRKGGEAASLARWWASVQSPTP